MNYKEIVYVYDNYFKLINDIRQFNKSVIGIDNNFSNSRYKAGSVKIKNEEIYFALTMDQENVDIFSYKNHKLPSYYMEKLAKINLFSNPNFMKHLNNEITIEELTDEYLDKMLKIKLFD